MHFFDLPSDEYERRAAPRRAGWRADPIIAAFLDQGLTRPRNEGERLLVALEDAGEHEALTRLVGLRSSELFQALCIANNWNATEARAVAALKAHLVRPDAR